VLRARGPGLHLSCFFGDVLCHLIRIKTKEICIVVLPYQWRARARRLGRLAVQPARGATSSRLEHSSHSTLRHPLRRKSAQQSHAWRKHNVESTETPLYTDLTLSSPHIAVWQAGMCWPFRELEGPDVLACLGVLH